MKNEELLSREEELSLVMMFNRVQTAEDLDITNWPKEQREIAQKILRKAPEAVLKLIAQMVHHFGLKLHAPETLAEKNLAKGKFRSEQPKNYCLTHSKSV